LIKAKANGKMWTPDRQKGKMWTKKMWTMTVDQGVKCRLELCGLDALSSSISMIFHGNY